MKLVPMLLVLLAVAVPAQERADRARDDYVRERLDSTTFTFQGDDVPFADLIQVIRETAEIDVLVDPGVDRPEPIQVRVEVRDLTLRQFLDFLAHLYGLEWAIEDGLVLVARAGSDRLVQTRSFPVEDLVGRLGADALRHLAAPAVEDRGGRALLVDRGRLVARGRREELDRVDDLLGQLRHALSAAHRLSVARVNGPLPAEGPGAAASLELPDGTSARVGGLEWRILPGPDASRARLRVRPIPGTEPPGAGVETEVVVPAGRWIELARRGPESLAVRIDPVAAPPAPEAAPSALERLEAMSIGSFEFEKHPLPEVVDLLRDDFELSLMIDPGALAGRAEEDLLVTARLHDMTLREATLRILAPFGLTLEEVHGVLLVREPADATPTLRLHDLRHTDSSGEGAGFLALLALEEEHAAVEALAAACREDGPRTLRIELRRGADEASLLASSGTRAILPLGEGDRLAVTVAFPPVGDPRIDVEGSTDSWSGRVATGERRELEPGGLSVLVSILD